MKAVDYKQAQKTVYAHLKKRQTAEVLLMTWKKDRQVVIRYGETVIVEEDGYVHQTVELSYDEAKSKIKHILAKEFPRSRRLYLQEKNN